MAVILHPALRIVDRKAHLRFLTAQPKLVKQAHKARIGAIVIHDESGIDGPGTLRRGDIHRGGMSPGVDAASNRVTSCCPARRQAQVSPAMPLPIIAIFMSAPSCAIACAEVLQEARPAGAEAGKSPSGRRYDRALSPDRGESL